MASNHWAMILPMSREAWEDEPFRELYRDDAAHRLGVPDGFELVGQSLEEGTTSEGDAVTVGRFTYARKNEDPR